MSQLMPKNEDDMLKIDGVTKSNFEKFGQSLLEITQQAAVEMSGISNYFKKEFTILFQNIIFYYE